MFLLKVEKNGASGVKDALTAEEIEHAKCIIVASDRQVEMARFDGKPMIQTKVARTASIKRKSCA